MMLNIARSPSDIFKVHTRFAKCYKFWRDSRLAVWQQKLPFKPNAVRTYTLPPRGVLFNSAHVDKPDDHVARMTTKFLSGTKRNAIAGHRFISCAGLIQSTLQTSLYFIVVRRISRIAKSNC